MGNAKTERNKTPQFRRAVYKRNGGCCAFCHERVVFSFMAKTIPGIRISPHFIFYADGSFVRRATIEHLTPISKGGKTKLTNLALACTRCNGKRAPKPAPRPPIARLCKRCGVSCAQNKFCAICVRWRIVERAAKRWGVMRFEPSPSLFVQLLAEFRGLK